MINEIQGAHTNQRRPTNAMTTSKEHIFAFLETASDTDLERLAQNLVRKGLATRLMSHLLDQSVGRIKAALLTYLKEEILNVTKHSFVVVLSTTLEDKKSTTAPVQMTYPLTKAIDQPDHIAQEMARAWTCITTARPRRPPHSSAIRVDALE